jgi:hypothetical protein
VNFELNGEVQTIGSKLFPVSNNSAIKLFYSDNTEPFSHDEFSKIIDFNKFEVGHCYTNSEMIRQISVKVGLSVEYYAGWFFMQQPTPIHHAWCIIDGKHLIDMGFSDRDVRFRKKVMNDPLARERYAEYIAHRKATIRPSKDCIMGKIPEGVLYVGSLDEIESARSLFRDTIKKYPKHPSYIHRGMNPLGASPMQSMIKQIQDGLF